MKRSGSLIIALAALLIFCGDHTQGKDSWVRVQTKNFTLVGNANERDIRKIAIKLETFRETLSILFPKAKIATPTPTTVVIFKSDLAFRPFKPRYQGKIRENVGGYFLPGPHMNYIVLAAEKEFVRVAQTGRLTRTLPQGGLPSVVLASAYSFRDSGEYS